jgi:hemolysin III
MITSLRSERVNFWTHFPAFLAWFPFTLFLVFRSSPRWDLIVVSSIYGLGVMFLFFCSANYHRLKRAENERTVWRTLDHFAIFVMIAASYTPIVWIWFDEPWRTGVLVLQWGVTVVGLAFKIFVPKAPRWVGPLLYLLMGWVAVLAIVPLYRKMPFPAFLDLFLGGVWYTVGAIIYALKKPNFRPGVFGFHELFHLFILAGAITHGSMVLRSITASLGPLEIPSP